MSVTEKGCTAHPNTQPHYAHVGDSRWEWRCEVCDWEMLCELQRRVAELERRVTSQWDPAV